MQENIIDFNYIVVYWRQIDKGGLIIGLPNTETNTFNFNHLAGGYNYGIHQLPPTANSSVTHVVNGSNYFQTALRPEWFRKQAKERKEVRSIF
jgi:hypothetical protein